MNGNLDTEIVRKIRALYGDEAGAKGLFDWLARRTNDVAETSIDRISAMVGMSRFEARELARSLSDIGVCDFIVGRKGWKSRVRWHYSVRSLGEAAKGKAAKIIQIDPELAEEVADQQAGTVDSDAPAVQGLTLAEAKRGLAVTFGVSPEAIEITIKA